MTRFRSFQATKYVVLILVLLFTYAAVYSAMYIYHDKYKHDGSRFSLIDLITGRTSNASKLKNTAEANQTAKLYGEYNAKTPNFSPADFNENSHRAVVLNFYEDYLNNKQANQSQDAALAAYGTANLADEYNLATNGFDPLICTSGAPDSIVITGNSTADGKLYYNLKFSNSTGVVGTSQAVLVSQDGKILIDKISCPENI